MKLLKDKNFDNIKNAFKKYKCEAEWNTLMSLNNNCSIEKYKLNALNSSLNMRKGFLSQANSYDIKATKNYITQVDVH